MSAASAPPTLLCEDCLLGSVAEADRSRYLPQPGISLLQPPSACRADSPAEIKLRSVMRELAEQCASMRRSAAAQSAAAAADAAAAAHAAGNPPGEHGGVALLSPSSSQGAEPSAQLAQRLIEHVLQALNELRLTGFVGAEVLLHTCVEPVRAAVVAALPAAGRASTPAILQTPDLGRTPGRLTARLAVFCEAQVAAFALSCASPPSPPTELWAAPAAGADEGGELVPAAGAPLAPSAASPLSALFAPPLSHYPAWQARAAALAGALAACGSAPSDVSRARRFSDLLREARQLAQERADLAALSRAAKSCLEKLLKEFDTRPEVSRGTPTKGDMAGASLALQAATLAWEEVLCAAMYVRHDVDAQLGARRSSVASEHLKVAAERLSTAQRAAEAERARDEEEHRKSFRALHKLRGGEGERQRAAAGEALEQRRVLRAHELQQAQSRVAAAAERSREAAHAVEAARKQRDSLAGWRDHVRHAAEGLHRASMHPEGSQTSLAHGATAAALFRNNRDMFYHDEHFHALRTDLAGRLRDVEAVSDELAAVRSSPAGRRL
jgi:hypothetical protein